MATVTVDAKRDVGRLYEASLEAVLHSEHTGDGAAGEDRIERLVTALLIERVSPAELVRLHAQAFSGHVAVERRDAAEYAAGMRLLECVLLRMQPDTRRVMHDLRNSLQILTGSLTLLERDLERGGSLRAPQLLHRARGTAEQLADRIDGLARPGA